MSIRLSLLYFYFVTGAINIYRFVTMSQLLDKVQDVDIDGHGRFKYILIDVRDEVNKASKQIVRGYSRAQWHGEFVDIYSVLYFKQDTFVTYLAMRDTRHGIFYFIEH